MDQRRRAAVRRAACAACECLECRTLLIAELLFEDWWVVTADHDQGQHIRLELVPGQTKKVRALIDGKVAGSLRLSDFEELEIELYGGAGNDRIEIGDGIPLMIWADGEGGDDTIVGSSAADGLVGGRGDDLLIGGAGDDYLSDPDGGHDTFQGGTGDDSVFGGPGDDVINGGAGRDTLLGNGGDDAIDGAAADADLVMGGFGHDTIRGTRDAWSSYDRGEWLIEGDMDPDKPRDRILIERDPADRAMLRAVVNGRVIDRVPVAGLRLILVEGGAGDDSIAYALGKIGGGIEAVANGGTGDDRIVGGPERNDFYGGDGDDTIDGGGGDDVYLSGGDGEDRVTPKDDDEFHEEDNVEVELEDGILYVWTGMDDPVRGSDVLVRLDPKDDGVIQVVVDGKLVGTARVGDVTDLSVDGTEFDDRITIDLPVGTGISAEAFGYEGDDTIVGGNGAEYLDGGPGDDSVLGNGGDDVLYGDAGRDVLDGGDGGDEIYGDSDYWDVAGPARGAGDTLIGGAGGDVLYGEIGDDHVSGGPGKDYLYGEGGADTLVGGGDGDVLVGDGGQDVIKAGPGDDDLHGGTGGDTLTGGGGGDNLSGDGGDDTLSGGTGTDTVAGGGGDDWLPGICGGDVIVGEDDGSGSVGGEAEVEALMRKKGRSDAPLGAGGGESLLS